MSAYTTRRLAAISDRMAPKNIVVVWQPLPEDPPEAWERFRMEMQKPAGTRIVVMSVHEGIDQ